MPKNTIKMGENSEKKNLDHFLTLNLDHFLTLKPPNLGPLFNFTVFLFSLYRERESKKHPSNRQQDVPFVIES